MDVRLVNAEQWQLNFAHLTMSRDFSQLLRLVDQLSVAVAHLIVLHVHFARIASESDRDLPRLLVGVLGRGTF